MRVRKNRQQPCPVKITTISQWSKLYYNLFTFFNTEVLKEILFLVGGSNCNPYFSFLFLRIKWKWQRKQTAVTKNRNKQFIFQISIHLTVCSKAMPIACQNMVMRVFTCHGTYITCYEGCWPCSRVTNLPQRLPWGLLIKNEGCYLKLRVINQSKGLW